MRRKQNLGRAGEN